MFRGRPRWLPSFLWIPDTPVVPPSAGTTGVPRMTAGGVAFVPLDARPRTLSFSLFLSVFKPSMLTIYSTLLYEGGRLRFDADGGGGQG